MQCLNTKDDRQFSDTYYKAAAVGDSIAISELTDDQISGVRARATATKSERRRNEKDETYLGMLRREEEDDESRDGRGLWREPTDGRSMAFRMPSSAARCKKGDMQGTRARHIA